MDWAKATGIRDEKMYISEFDANYIGGLAVA